MNDHTITITPSEWLLIQHRLELIDCLVEVISSTFDWPPEAIEAKTEALQRECDRQFKATGRIVLNLLTMDKQTLEVLKDTMDGSTYLCDLDEAVAQQQTFGHGGCSRGTALSMQRAATSLEAKMLAAGHKVSIPRA